MGDGEPGARVPGRKAGAVRPTPQTRPGAWGGSGQGPGPRPGDRTAPPGLSTYEISAHLAREGTPLNRTSVGEILTEEGFGRLLRHPAEAVSTAVSTPGRDTRLPRTAALDFTTWPARLDSAKAGLLLLVPVLVTLDLPALIAGRLSRHPRGARRLVTAIAAGVEADPDPPGLPRR